MATNDHDASRRRILKGAGLTMAAATAGPAFAGSQQGASQNGAAQNTPRSLENPQNAYPKPPFDYQTQPWPALAGKMHPRPDHGEQSYRGSNRLAGRRALITGGDSGIGRAAAIAYAREGADVAINYLPDEEPDAREVVELIEAAGRRAVAIAGDIRDENFCQQLVNQAANQLGGLDILVLNAARQQSHDSIMDITTEQFDWTVKTNLYAMFWLSKAAIPHLPEGGAIINTTSTTGWTPPEDLLDYAMTKAAISNFTKGLAKQMADRGIRVNAVAPGPFWTPLQVCSNASEEKLTGFGGDTPMKRPGQPAELAGVYVQLAESSATYLTGEIYAATGGKTPL